MFRFKIGVFVVLSVFSVLIFCTTKVFAQTGVKAFPQAEGFGANTVGGRGGTVYIVANLNDSGSGSLRECVNASGPRICVFRVGGTITLSSVLTISNPFITIAGQTAPGGGITLRKSNGGDIFNPETHDIVIRYITGRPGPGGENHAVQIADSNSNSLYNIIFDHCSFSWGVDSVWETWYRVYDLTLQWTFATEGLDCSTHSKGCHSKGVMIGGYKFGEGSTAKGSYNITMHHNLMAHNGERNPLMQFCGTGQVVNNITYNPYWTFSHQEDNCIDQSVNSTVNWIGNYHKRGPDSTSNSDLKMISDGAGVSHIYVHGNIGPSRTSDTLPDINWVDSGSRGFVVSSPASAPSVTTTSASDAYNEVLATGGNSSGLDCSGNFYSRRDAIDTRIVNDVRNGTGHIIDDPSDVGGWVNIASGSACTDSDNDGMPNEWENRYGFNPNSASDNNLDYDNDGYKNVEEFLNGTDPKNGSSQTPVPTPQTLPGDVNSDGTVNIQDYQALSLSFGKSQGQSGFNSHADFNSDGIVNIQDYQILSTNFGRTI